MNELKSIRYKMNELEYLEKCISILNVLAKIANGVEVSFEERLKTGIDAIRVWNYENSQRIQFKKC